MKESSFSCKKKNPYTCFAFLTRGGNRDVIFLGVFIHLKNQTLRRIARQYAAVYLLGYIFFLF